MSDTPVVNGEPSSQNYILKNNDPVINKDHAGNILIKMNTFLNNEQLCDVILIAGNDGKRVSAHRIVLSSASEYFAAMFTGSHREAEEKEITLHDVNGDVLEILVKHCYTGLLEYTKEVTESLLSTADLLQLSSAVKICCDFMVSQLHPSNCLGFISFAERHNCQMLLKSTTEFTCLYFTEVYMNEEFLNLNVEELVKLLLNDDLNVPSEETVFNALKLWVEHDVVNRKKCIPDLLVAIRLPLLSPLFIVDNVEKFCDSDECSKPINAALRYHFLPERRPIECKIRRQFKNLDNFTLLAVCWNYEHSICIRSYYPQEDRWNVLSNLPIAKGYFEITILQTELIIAGGWDDSKCLDTVECLDLKTMRFSPLAPMQNCRWGLSFVQLNGSLYAIGGCGDDSNYLNTVERWDPTKCVWYYVNSMNLERQFAGAIVYNEKIYICGGQDSMGCLDSVECYDPITDEWTFKALMNKKRSSLGVAAVNGYLYAVGGNGGDGTIERYDPFTNAWTLIASAGISLSSITCAVLKNRIIAISDKSTAEYDAEKQEWRQLSNIGEVGFPIAVTVSNTMLPIQNF